MDRTELAYLAGLVDGEGYVSVTKETRKSSRMGYYHHPVVSVGNTNPILCLAFLSFGGHINFQELSGNRKDRYMWSIQTVRTAEPFLLAIRPYLRAKRKQADLVLEFCIGKEPRQWSVSPTEMDRREMIYQKLRVLNRRGKKTDDFVVPTVLWEGMENV